MDGLVQAHTQWKYLYIDPVLPEGHQTVLWGQVRTMFALLAVRKKFHESVLESNSPNQSAARDSAGLEGFWGTSGVIRPAVEG